MPSGETALNRRQGLKAALGLAGMAAGAPWARAAEPAVVALSEQRNRFLVDVEINGQAGFRFLLDTGANTHFVSTRVADALALPQVGERMARRYQGRGREKVVALSALSVGGVAVGPTRAVAWPQEGRDGTIGYPFLFPAAVLQLGAREVMLRTRAPDGLVAVPAHVSFDQTLLIGGIGGVEGRFLFDTGAQDCVISPAYLQRIAKTRAFRDAPRLISRNTEGSTEMHGFRPEEIAFGDFRIANPYIRIAPEGGAGNVFDGVDGLFGVSLIRPYAWGIDQTAGSLRVGPMTPA